MKLIWAPQKKGSFKLWEEVPPVELESSKQGSLQFMTPSDQDSDIILIKNKIKSSKLI